MMNDQNALIFESAVVTDGCQTATLHDTPIRTVPIFPIEMPFALRGMFVLPSGEAGSSAKKPFHRRLSHSRRRSINLRFTDRAFIKLAIVLAPVLASPGTVLAPSSFYMARFCIKLGLTNDTVNVRHENTLLDFLQLVKPTGCDTTCPLPPLARATVSG